MGYFSTFLHIVSWCEKKQQQQRKVFLENHFVPHCGCQVYVNRASRTCSVEFWIFFTSFFDVIQKTQNRAFKADDMFESNPVKRGHFTELLKSVTSGVCEIGSENTKKPEKEKPQRYCNRLIYLFILSALGHCYHDNSLMASFASLFLIFFSLHSLHICNIFVWRTLMTVVILPSPSPPTVLYFSSLTPPSWRLVLWKTKYKKKKIRV